jgi:predicted secreted hydrolase
VRSVMKAGKSIMKLLGGRSDPSKRESFSPNLGLLFPLFQLTILGLFVLWQGAACNNTAQSSRSTHLSPVSRLPSPDSHLPTPDSQSSPEPQPLDEWRQALPGYTLQFPRDHASHPDYKIEWWYYTGNLQSSAGRRFGYQLTFFRIGVELRPANPSRWAVRDLFITHLAVTDVSGESYRFAERINRQGVGWAGAATDRYRVWNEDWEAHLDPSGRHSLKAMEGGIGVDLKLEAGKPPVLHGERGVSQKGSQPGNASYYYSLTRMPTSGTLLVNGAQVKAEGVSWMDHEFGTSFLETGQTGWDWFSLQLEDGTDLMLFQLRRLDGSRDRHSSGTVVGPSGQGAPIDFHDFNLEAGLLWGSPSSGARYPVEWGVSIPSRGLNLNVRAALPDQELRTGQSTGVTYWEGSVEVSGEHQGRPARGRGYLEMTGYAGGSMDALLK